MQKPTPRAALVALLVLGTAASLPAAGDVILEVGAGKHPRRDVPIAWPLPAALASARQVRMARIDAAGDVPVAAQVIPGDAPRLVWILERELAAGETRRYRLSSVVDPAASEPTAADPVAAAWRSTVECSNDGSRILFRARGRRVLAYNHAHIEPPSGFDPVFGRSGYIHPLWTPSGRVVTNDSPPNHRHHHGLWFAWTNTSFEGRKIDFWNSADRLGRVEFAGLDGFSAGPVCGWLRARHRHLDLKAPGGEKAVLDETWEVQVWALDGYNLFDITSVEQCVGGSPLALKEYRYGGLGLRGSGDWEGPNVAFLTSEGKTREDGHATEARWCELHGNIGGLPAGASILSHPANFRAPQRMRIHPTEPFFNFAPCQSGDFEIAPGTPYVSRYRFYVHDGPVDAAQCERLWTDYAEPPDVRVVE